MLSRACARAACAEGKPQVLAGLSSVSRRACHSAAGSAPYLAYAARKGAGVYTAEGASQIADVLETGLRVVSGAAKPPADTAVQVSAANAEIAADFGGAAGGLARAQAAAAADPARLRARAYVQNNEWRFDLAETDFQALVGNSVVQLGAGGSFTVTLAAGRTNVSFGLIDVTADNAGSDIANGATLQLAASVADPTDPSGAPLQLPTLQIAYSPQSSDTSQLPQAFNPIQGQYNSTNHHLQRRRRQRCRHGQRQQRNLWGRAGQRDRGYPASQASAKVSR